MTAAELVVVDSDIVDSDVVESDVLETEVLEADVLEADVARPELDLGQVRELGGVRRGATRPRSA